MSTFVRQPKVELRTILGAISTIVILGLILAYIVFQARFLIAGPQIVISDNLAIQHNERTIHLEGTAYNITHLWLNDRQIYTDESGHFSEALVLENGYTIATLRAKDRYGRETRVERPFVYTPASINKNN
ncbi:MAG: hypothetical protein R3B53_01385 [Candidatus Paceibacterota bacterium]